MTQVQFDYRRLALWAAALFVLMAMFTPDMAHAAGAGGGLPYEVWLESLRDSITGPVAFTLGLVAVVVTGGVLVFGGELNAFARAMIFLALAMGLIITATNVMSGFFGSAGAVI